MEAQERSSTSKRKLDDEDVPSDEQEQPESKRLKMDDDTAETEVAAEAVNADAAQEAAEAGQSKYFLFSLQDSVLLTLLLRIGRR
jgi:uncharacterized protein YcbX